MSHFKAKQTVGLLCVSMCKDLTTTTKSSFPFSKHTQQASSGGLNCTLERTRHFVVVPFSKTLRILLWCRNSWFKPTFMPFFRYVHPDKRMLGSPVYASSPNSYGIEGLRETVFLLLISWLCAPPIKKDTAQLPLLNQNSHLKLRGGCCAWTFPFISWYYHYHIIFSAFEMSRCLFTSLHSELIQTCFFSLLPDLFGQICKLCIYYLECVRSIIYQSNHLKPSQCCKVTKQATFTHVQFWPICTLHESTSIFCKCVLVPTIQR